MTLQVDNLYPPSALLLFVPFVFLPAILWWAIPLGVTGYPLSRRGAPAWWAWPLMALLIVWPKTTSSVLWGNNGYVGCHGCRCGASLGLAGQCSCWSSPPWRHIALVGIRSRSFWMVGLVMLALSVLMLPLWIDYFHGHAERADPVGLLAAKRPCAATAHRGLARPHSPAIGGGSTQSRLVR